MAGPEAGSIFFGSDAPAGAYSNWIPGERNNRSGNENGLEILSFSRQPFQWNDLPLSDAAPNGFLVEWSFAAGVPEPAN